MTRVNCLFLSLTLGLMLCAAGANAQTNFDETWREFLVNNKISRMSELVRPDKVYAKDDYAKYLLMNTNTSFCQSDVADAERLMGEVREMEGRVLESVPGFVQKMDDLNSKIKAYYTMDGLWQRFLDTKQVSPKEMDAITAAKTSCEKSTLAKYSFMTAYAQFCRGDVAQAKEIFETRTLTLTEKTSLRVEDVPGMAEEVKTMKMLFQELPRLDAAWQQYVSSGVSPGFDRELPVFACNPNPKVKELVLRGVLDYCGAAPQALAGIKELQAASGGTLDGEVAKKVKELEANIGKKDQGLVDLNAAWAAFIPNNEVDRGSYGYDYCSKEPLVRAYIMDGFLNVCDLGEAMLRKIEALHQADPTPLEPMTTTKFNELAARTEEYRQNGVELDKVWRRLVGQGDKLPAGYQSAEFYCDNIHQIKDWTMRGLLVSCEAGFPYLEQIDEFQRNFEFSFTDEVECRVQKLRIRVWTCRYEALEKLARVEAPDNYEARLRELMQDYGVGERPEVCDLEK